MARILTVFALTVLLAGCGPFGSPAEEATAIPTRTPVPTYTPTPVTPPTLTTAATATPAPAVTVEVPDALAATAPAAVTREPAVAAFTAAARPQLTITSDLVNVRSGPDTTFDLVGEAKQGETYDVVAKTPAGDWWQICCIAGQKGWVFGELATVANGEAVAIAGDMPAAPTTAALAEAPTEAPAGTPAETPTAAPDQAQLADTPAAPSTMPDPSASSAGWFDPNAQYQIVHFKVLGLDENNGGIRDSSAQHLIFLTVLDQNGNGVDGAVVKNLVGNEKGEVVTGSKGPGKAEITMYYEPFKLMVASDPSGPVTSQVSNQMGLVFPHLPDLVGNLGDVNYEYGACPTIDIKCQWPISAIHFSYELTFQKVK